MSRGRWLRIATLAGVFAGCSGGAVRPERSLDHERISAHIRHLTETIGPRFADSAAARRAADYLAGQLQSYGLRVARTAVGTVNAPSIRVGPKQFLPARTFYFQDHNLVTRFAGTGDGGDAILLMAHYDTVSGSPGAVDNAAGVAILLELARVLKEKPPAVAVIIAFTAAEEWRLSGARALAPTLDGQVGLAVSLDMIGAAGALTLNGLSSLIGRAWLDWLAASAVRSGVDLRAPIPHRVISRHVPQIERSDHGVFTARGIPAFHLYSRPADRLYLRYHSRLDTADQIDPDSIDDAARFIVGMIENDAPQPEAGGNQGFWIPGPGRPIVVSSIILIAVELLLLAMALAGIVVLARRRQRARRRGLGLLAVLGLYPVLWLGASGCLWLASTITEHPSPWVHAPLRFYAAGACVAGALGMVAAWLIAIKRPRPGEGRYLVVAVGLPACFGVALVVMGAPELAWIPLVIAAALGTMAAAPSAWTGVPLLVVSAVPLWSVLDPGFAREGIFNGFFPADVPISACLAVLLMPHALAIVYAFKRWGRPWPRTGWPAYAIVSVPVLVIIAAVLAMSAPAPACTGKAFVRQGLYCELGSE